MGGFAFVFGFLVLCFGVVLVSVSGGLDLLVIIGEGLLKAGAIMAAGGVIGQAVERAGRRVRAERVERD